MHTIIFLMCFQNKLPTLYLGSPTQHAEDDDIAAEQARQPGAAAPRAANPPLAIEPLSNDTLAAMRICRPNLSSLPDAIMRVMDPSLRTQLNAGVQPF